MNELTVGIIGARLERHCIYLSQELERQGARALILDNLPGKPFPLSYGEESSRYHDQSDLDLTEMKVCFLRALFLPTPAFEVSEQIAKEGYVAYMAERERYAAWLSWLMSAPFDGRWMVNPVETLMIHFAKPYHLARLRHAGIPVPKTLVTSHAETLLEFSRGRKIVYKPVAGGAYCRLFTEEDRHPDRLEALMTAPVQFQEYIEGEDLRVFVLDGKVIASFLVEGEGIDYRKGTTDVKPCEVTPEVASMCIKACETLGLIFSGIDLKRQPDGSVVCIECNPSPMFEGFDRVAPVPIVSQLAAWLIGKAKQLQTAQGNISIFT